MGGPGDLVPIDDVQIPAQLLEVAVGMQLEWPETSERGLCGIAITYLSIADDCRRTRDSLDIEIVRTLAGNHSTALDAFAVFHLRLAGATPASHMAVTAAAAGAIGSCYLAAAAIVGTMKLRLIVILARAAAYLAMITIAASYFPPAAPVLAAMNEAGKAVVAAADVIVDEGTEQLATVLNVGARIIELYTGVAVPLLRSRQADIDRSATQTVPAHQPGHGYGIGEVDRHPNENTEQKRGHDRQQEAAEILAAAGYVVKHLPNQNQDEKNPDYDIQGEIWDCYAPTTQKTSAVRDEISEKVAEHQANRVVVYLKDTTVTVPDLRKNLRMNPVAGCEEVVAIAADGTVVPIYP